ncbi:MULTISPECIES: hypothetical protein [Paenarthrobacter]|uniref:Uncharacterized protein n=1 Tax=Paenarthrobacter ureafaciens TaxID=37931 RepID=A0AAX3EFU0_PAEUR|nr:MULTISPECIES: hypothetical protein [Paenarthrobacter]MDO5866011.1 hypothetical protein [Paenarthrobacter sp. SD-2]MDO5877107.1 hypothetical protein [Paenarthrobacter sp. SD-1]UYV92309.1 hypothetical protein NL395_17570 [Paenarthrobacter ureafaciens]UYV96844.1 hypothetical protein NL394_17600 [Paenarthrobacter ureafaciens]
MNDNVNVPEEAVHAARVAYRREFPYDENEDHVLTTILTAAVPFINKALKGDA